MSWRSGGLAAAMLMGALAFGSAGCGFQPLYGSTATGAKLGTLMAAVDVVPIPGRVGQKVRNELIFTNTGGGQAEPPRYKLDIAIKESIADQLVQISGNVTTQVFQLNAVYKLTDVSTGKTLTQGSAVSRAPYDRYQEIFSNVRARYDAENRAARTVAESIRTQVAAFLSTMPPWSPISPQPWGAS